ncbi:hypothetical protein [Methanosarcina sp.]|uniref:hypothetical protein n=1 Tax=Methanosarcina sp. TaxID=2213 RepID=UPI002988821B|nr:hypothetical protein [Methanosarcina sp.]MDW5552144.1 hypothetical protein [Methanosarcina sp.]MDW5555875.1 hypothetical protein [Methanosarcina sp.]
MAISSVGSTLTLTDLREKPNEQVRHRIDISSVEAYLRAYPELNKRISEFSNSE